jgi:hypothetical protein
MATKRATLPGGILIPQLFNADLEPVGTGGALTTDSSYTEAGPRPGQAIVVDPLTIARVEVSGAQGVDFEVEARAPGNPGTGAAFLVKQTGDAVTKWRGWDGTQLLCDWHPIDYDAGSVTARSYDAVTIPSTQTTIIADYDDNVGLKTYSVSKALGVTTQGTIAAAGNWNNPALLVLPESERVLLFFGGTAYYSEDLGATWNIWSDSIIVAASTNYGRTRVAIYRGSIIMAIEDTATAGTWRQFASADLGASFQVVATPTDGLDVDVNATAYGVVVTYIDGTTRPGALKARVLSSAWEEITIQTPVEVTASTRQYQTTSVDQAGKIYIFASNLNKGYIYTSADRGATWTTWAQEPYELGDVALRLNQFASTWAMGRLLVLHVSASTSVPNDYMTGLMVYGGHSNVTMGADTTVTVAGTPNPANPDQRRAYSTSGAGFDPGLIWIPIELPAAAGWTAVGTAPTIVTPGELKIPATVATSYSTLAISSTEVAMDVVVRLVSAGLSTQRDCAVVIRIANGVYDYEVEVIIHSTGIVVNDTHSATGATATRDTTVNPFHIRILMNQGAVEVWDKDLGATIWNATADLVLTDDAATPKAGGLIAWGKVDSSATVSHWRMVNVAASVSGRLEFLSGASVLSKPWTANPEPIPDMGSGDSVAWLSMTAGPARVGDSWTIAAKHDYGIEHIDPVQSPSPAQTWRSTDTAEQIIVYDLGADTWVGDSLALYVANANFRKVFLDAWTGAAWVNQAELDLADGFTGLAHDLAGRSVIVNTATTSTPSRFLWDSELRGAWAYLDGQAGATSEAHRLTVQSAGSWTNETTVHPVLTLATATGLADGVLNSAGNTRTLELNHTAGFVVIHPAATARKRYLRLRIPAGSIGKQTPTGEGYYEAGAMLVCRVQPFGVRPGWGYSDELMPSLDVTVDAAGTRHARQRSTPARTFSAPLSDVTELVDIRAGTDLEYVAGAAGVPLAAFNDVGQLIQGLFRATDSGALPVVYVESIPETSGAIVTDPSLFVYGHMTGTARIDNHNGDLGIDETNRIGGLQFKELV